MFSLATIQRMNNAVEARKARRRARALNAKNKKHPKNAEKTGHVCEGPTPLGCLECYH
jgi:hypothetical protein